MKKRARSAAKFFKVETNRTFTILIALLPLTAVAEFNPGPAAARLQAFQFSNLLLGYII